MSVEKDTGRSGRKTLKTLQQTATESENLVGRGVKNLKHQLSQDIPPIDVEAKRKNITHKETQANFVNKVTVEDLTNTEGASEKYWELLAKKRQVALQEALEENEKLQQLVAKLKTENGALKQMLDEANTFVEIVKELADNDNDDTGIDVNDVSAAEEVPEPAEEEEDNPENLSTSDSSKDSD